MELDLGGGDALRLVDFRAGSMLLVVGRGCIGGRIYVTTRGVSLGRISGTRKEGSGSEGDGGGGTVARENFDCIQSW